MAWTYDGYRPTEIAAVLGKPPATVRSALREARIALRRTYRPDEETS
jgi:RNA polymerase sigma-70 factor (ECF subfamily)